MQKAGHLAAVLTRRDILVASGATLAASAIPPIVAASCRAHTLTTTSHMDRASWVALLMRIANPVVTNAGSKPPGYVPLEAIGRTLSGMAPWLSLSGLTGTEETQRAACATQMRNAIVNNMDPEYAPPHPGTIGVVDCAFLALGLLRSKSETWDQFGPGTRGHILTAFTAARSQTVPQPLNNWVLFFAILEACRAKFGESWDVSPITTALNAYSTFYAGDGAYGDGTDFQHDYYASYVGYPFLLAILDAMAGIDNTWEPQRATIMARAKRYVEVLERSIAPDGSFPAIGRSITYRSGAFHHLADMALRHELTPPSPRAPISPAQVRCALGAMLNKTLNAPNTFRASDWLHIGLAGNQPSLTETYISGSSLYMCTLAFLPLGLLPADPFWSDADEDWTWKKIWTGVNLPADAPY